MGSRTEEARARDEARQDSEGVAKRSYGSGSPLVREDKRGRETWDANVRVGGRQSKRAIGPKRESASRRGLTRSQAEGRLRKLLDELALAPPMLERLTVEEGAAGTRNGPTAQAALLTPIRDQRERPRPGQLDAPIGQEPVLVNGARLADPFA
jgi:hypothetical protein